MPDEGREWGFYIADMIRFAGNVIEYTGGLDRETFARHRLIYDAALRNLELIGEAATHIPTELREANPAIPWRRIIATRNRLFHGFLGIDDDTIWSIICNDVPNLIAELRRIPQRAADSA